MSPLKAMVALVAVCSLGQASAEDTIIQTFAGSGASNTRPFAVNDGWEIQWDATGDIFQLFLYSADGELVGVAANQSGPGKGASFEPLAGRYYLQVNAIGRWIVSIVQIPSQASNPTSTGGEPGVIAMFSGSGARNTRPFTASGPWEIQWDARGDIFQLFLYATDGELVGVAANQSGPATGSCYQPAPGRYYLQVNALGRWGIRVVPIE